MNKAPLLEILSTLKVEILHQRDDGWITCRCPFAGLKRRDGTPYHKSATDHRPSFFVRASARKRSGYNCYSCGMSGNIASLIEALEHGRGKRYKGLAIRANLKELESGVSFDYDGSDDDTPEPLHEEAFSNLYPGAWESKRCRSYLLDRGISRSTAEMLGLLYDEEDRRVLFPVRDRQQRLFGFTGRTLLREDQFPNPWYGKVKDYAGLKKRRLLLGAQFVDLTKPVMVVEGLFAYAAQFEEQVDTFMHPVGTMGAYLSRWQADTLVEWGKPVYLFYDNDQAGRVATYGYRKDSGEKVPGAVNRLVKELPVFVAQWPDGWEGADPDDLSFKMVRRMMKRAVPGRIDKTL